jgi:hypothetical protein
MLVLAMRASKIHCFARVVTIAGDFRDLPPFAEDCRAIAFTHDEQHILAGAAGEIPVFMVPIHGGTPPVRLKSPHIQVVDIATSPNSNEVLLGTGKPRPDVWTLSGFAPGVR